MKEGFDSYLYKMETTSKYGSHTELVALSTVLDVQFIIHELHQPPLLIRDHENRPENSRTLHLVYYPTILHYENVQEINLDGNMKKKLDLKDVPIFIQSKNEPEKKRNSFSSSQPNLNHQIETFETKNYSASQSLPGGSKNKKEFNWELLNEEMELELNNLDDLFKTKVQKKISYRHHFRHLKTPTQFFELFFTEEVLDLIINFTNQRA